MRWSLVLLAASVGGTLALVVPAACAQAPAPAQPLPALPPPPPTLPPASYAHNLLHVMELIEEAYVRPVARVDLLVAALHGLYEVSGESVPLTLREEAGKAVKSKEVLRLLDRTRKRPEIARRVNDDEALLASCRAMLRTLDPHCEILMGDDARRTSGRMDNFGVGIDLEETGSKGTVKVKDVLPGSPGQKAGLRPGDCITAINGRPLAGENVLQTTLLLNQGDPRVGDANDREIDILMAGGFVALSKPSKARITVQREGQPSTREVIVERCQFQAETVFGVRRRDDNTWDYWIDREAKIAHLRVGPLREGTAAELGQILSQLERAGIRGLLLDLRWCPGGLLDSAKDVAALFVDKGILATMQFRSKTDAVGVHQASEHDGPYRAVPILVLVNQETSGGGELIAAALQDRKRAAVAGQRTRGKASVQTMRALPARGAFLKLTTAVFLRPSGKNLNRFPDSKPADDWGVRPGDGLEFRISTGMNRQLRDWWTAQTLRPGSSHEVQPLDDPSNDPQRQLALQALRDRLK